MTKSNPAYFDPYVMADRGAVFEGEFSPSELSRLAKELANDEGKIYFRLQADREGKIARITGDVKASFHIKCQVCLEPLYYETQIATSLAAVSSIDEADRLPSHYEPLLVDDENIELKALIEDELLLSLPDYPRHSTCKVKAASSSSENLKAHQEDVNKANPFDVLSELLKK